MKDMILESILDLSLRKRGTERSEGHFANLSLSESHEIDGIKSDIKFHVFIEIS